MTLLLMFALSGNELQRPANGSPGLLADPLASGAQQGPACQQALHPHSEN